MAKKKSIKEIIAESAAWADYSIKDFTPKYEVRRFEDNRGNRFYHFKKDEDVKIASGVTSSFGIVSTERKAIDTWKESHDDWRKLLDVSAEYGTGLHQIYGGLLLKNKVDIELLAKLQKLAYENGSSYDMVSKDILSFLKFMEDYKLTPLIIEGVLVWEDSSGEFLAMTIDLLAKMTVKTKVKKEVLAGKYVRGDKTGQDKYETVTEEVIEDRIVLVDFKSNFFEKEKKSFYETNKMQLMSAKLAVEQNFDIKIDAVYNYSGLAWRTEPSYTLTEHKLTDEDWSIFYAYWNTIKVKGLNKPEGKILVTGDFKDSKDFKYLSYREYVEQVLLKP